MSVIACFGPRRCGFRPWRPSEGRVFDRPYALDAETDAIAGHEVPAYVLGAACDGECGVFLTMAHVGPFLRAHDGVEVVMHNAPFDLAVLDYALRSSGDALDVYEMVDSMSVWDTQLLHRLHALAADGACQLNGSSLEACAREHLGVELPKDVKDGGHDVRKTWARWLGRPAAEIPLLYLEYLARDALCTIACFDALRAKVERVLRAAAPATWGFINKDWLDSAVRRYGPLTHHIQLQATVALDAAGRGGLGVDAATRDVLFGRMREEVARLEEELRRHGYLEGKGSQKALQKLIGDALRDSPGVEVPRTETGLYSTAADALAALAPSSPFVAAYLQMHEVRSLLSHLEKACGTRVHPRYDVLKVTGRTSTSSPNVQGFPRKASGGADLRRCFAPAPGRLFYVADYATVEMRTLSQVVTTQFKLDSAMAEAINGGSDLHRLVAARMKASSLPEGAAVLADPARLAALAASLTKQERDAAKPANFGLPVGMGAATLRAYAQANYGQAYTDEDAEGWKAAWLETFPEMRKFLQDDGDLAVALADLAGLDPAGYAAATGGWPPSGGDLARVGWLGGMAMKVLRHELPANAAGVPYGGAALDYLWTRLQALAPRLELKLAADLRARRSGWKLASAVKNLAGRRPVITATGRVRAAASYTQQRNTLFQGLAADGAKLALYRLWRAGFTVSAFVHDEFIIEVDESAGLAAVKQVIDGILIGSMREVCPDVAVEVEGGFRRRWGKDPSDAVPLPASGPKPS